MYETRLPLEESTVFSQVNFTLPNYKEHPLVLRTTPYTVTLNPGDILYVPRNWWHFVESLSNYDYTCSVNLWIDQPYLDNKVRFRESLTQLITFSLISNCKHIDHRRLLHPFELKTYETETWFTNLVDYLRLLYRQNFEILSSEDKEKEENFRKVKQLIPIFENDSQFNVMNTLSFENIINAFIKPDVIELVAKHLESDIINKSL
ncbi:unnamed protein product [Heterobilharzia americana]|nr:unnamed protein product [Heterobilharzia americana]